MQPRLSQLEAHVCGGTPQRHHVPVRRRTATTVPGNHALPTTRPDVHRALTRAPVLHPAYNSVPQQPQMVADALRAVEAKLGMRPTGGQAPSTWFRELTVGVM